MKSFILVAVLVVISKADDTENVPLDVFNGSTLDADSLETSLAAKVDREGSNPYASVGLCRDDILSKRVKDFNIDEIANSGNYNYLYATSSNIYCASAEIHGDNTGYRGSATSTGVKGKAPVKLSYGLNVTVPGVIEETYTGVDANGQPVTNIYKLVILEWFKEQGVFMYVRCSDKGTSTTDNRSIVVRDCSTKPDSPGIVIANTLYKLDYLFGLKGSLKPINICKK